MRAYIRHPSSVPIELIRERTRRKYPLCDLGLGGLCCDTDQCLERDTLVEVRLPSIRPIYASRGRIAWCRPHGGGYRVGIQFLDPEDAFRGRMVEQICHIEHYRQEMLDREGRELSDEEAAMEWIEKYADRFPDLGAG